MMIHLRRYDEPVTIAGAAQRQGNVVGRSCFPIVDRRHLADNIVHARLHAHRSLTPAGTGVAGIQRLFGKVPHTLTRLEKAAHVVAAVGQFHQLVAHLRATARAPPFGARTVFLRRILALPAEHALHGLLELVLVFFGRRFPAEAIERGAELFFDRLLRVCTAFAHALRLAGLLFLIARLADPGCLQHGLHRLVPDLLIGVVHGGHERGHHFGMLRRAPEAGKVFDGGLFLADLVLGGLGLGGSLDRRIARLLGGRIGAERVGHTEKAPDRHRRAGGLGMCRRREEHRLHKRDGQPRHACAPAHGERRPAAVAQTCWQSHSMNVPLAAAASAPQRVCRTDHRAAPINIVKNSRPHARTAWPERLQPTSRLSVAQRWQ